MAKLKKLDITDGYVRQLNEVDTLRYALFELHGRRVLQIHSASANHPTASNAKPA
jgi:hypothetical protein